MPKNSSTFHSRIRYGIMDENGMQFGDIKDPMLFSLPTARKVFEENLNDLGQQAQIVKVRVTYEVLDYDGDAFTVPE
jgi:hypothetical protein